MQAICGSPSIVRPDPATTLGLDETDAHFKLPTSDRLLSRIRSSAIKPDIGTPMRVPVDSNGQRLYPTPRSARALNFGSSELKWHTNPAFQPLETVESLPCEQSQPLNVLVESDGLEVCPTPKITSHNKPRMKFNSGAASSPGGQNLRLQKPLHFEPLETIPSPAVLKEQLQISKRVLGDSNGQWLQEFPIFTENATSFKAKTTASGTSCFESMTPRNLFNETPRSKSRINSAKADKKSSSLRTQESPMSPDSVMQRHEGEAAFTSEALVNAPDSNMRKRARDRDGAAECDENTRITRSKAEAERIAAFLKSPAVRVRLSDGSRQEYQGTPRKSTLKLFDITEKNMSSAPGGGCGEAVAMEAESSQTFTEREKLPVVAELLPTVEEPPFQFPLFSFGVPPRTPSVKSTNKQIVREIHTPAATSGVSRRPSTKQGSAKKNLSLLL
ncbi:uncharacterized protein [Physcomitrium patens]|uniref:Uncharacterized protein n=1 Tax=Physcomitrium patens TaxID=3218 RepID=A0A2K1KKV5_PHYPA|nr:uncharacterized protein LOC112282187 isoform X1 [Physcomitrium patens]PNR54405.1 hypothetical protein PHYPA_008082 [Physcomitrium patens]|eukprot:XP_024375305.1 uncharacterized protein LOC112282187 isoform X1 [Physcomitrella patens]